MALTIAPIAEAHAASLHACLDTVAREQRYLALLEAPPLQDVQAFVRHNVAGDAVQFVALDGERVVGWADILPGWAHALAHCGRLGMGLLPEVRGRGLGRRLLAASLDKALAKGMTRVELEARADNARAIALYERLGFRHEGRKRCAMRLGGAYFDTLQMAWLAPGLAAAAG